MMEKRRAGFTLVELLVVIAIVVVLAGLIFSVSSRMIGAAKATACSNNLRQHSPVIHALREEGVGTTNTPPGCFPPYAGQISVPSWRAFNIYELVGEQAGFCVADGNDFKWQTHPSDTFLQNPLSPNTLCDGQEVGEITHKSFTSFGGFGYNALVEGWVSKNTDPSKLKQTRIYDVKYPELTLLMAEQNPEHTGAAVWFGPWNKVTPAGTYNESAHCLFVDGHVEMLRNDYLSSEEAKNKHYWPKKVSF